MLHLGPEKEERTPGFAGRRVRSHSAQETGRTRAVFCRNPITHRRPAQIAYCTLHPRRPPAAGFVFLELAMNPPDWLTQFADLAHAMPLHVAAVEVRRLQWHMEAPGRWVTEWVGLGQAQADLARNLALVEPAAWVRQWEAQVRALVEPVRQWEAQWADLARNLTAAVEASEAAREELGIPDAHPLRRKVSPRGMVGLAELARELRALGLAVVPVTAEPLQPSRGRCTDEGYDWAFSQERAGRRRKEVYAEFVTRYMAGQNDAHVQEAYATAMRRRR